MKRIAEIVASLIVLICTAIAGYGSLKYHNQPMTTESHTYYAEDVIITCTPREWVPPETVPEIHLASYQLYTQEEIYLLSQLAMAEARGEDAIGQALVIRTVLNRCERTGKSIEEVIYARGQFATASIGTYEPNANNLQAVRMVIYEDWDESDGCIYFNAEGYSIGTPLFKHGGHYFSK